MVEQNKPRIQIMETDYNTVLSAVQWLALRYHHKQGYLSQADITEALEMEREQQYACANFWSSNYLENAAFDTFYKQTYNKQ